MEDNNKKKEEFVREVTEQLQKLFLEERDKGKEVRVDFRVHNEIIFRLYLDRGKIKLFPGPIVVRQETDFC
jgi:hypothetical protein